MKKTRILLVSLAILFISVVSPYVAATDTPYNEIEENVAEITGDTTEKINDHLTINYDEPFTVGDGSGAMPLSLTNTPLYGADIDAGIYRIKNEFSDMYIDIHGPSSSGLIHQWTFSTSSSELWYIEPYILDTEYYIIQSMHYDLAFMGTFGFATNTDNVALNTIADPDGIMHSDSTLWKIYSTNDGRMVLFPKANHSSIICLTAPSDDVGDELVQSSYYESDSQFWTLESLEPIESGSYFLYNVQHEEYLQMDDDVSANTRGSVIETFDFDTTYLIKWDVQYLNNGYYKITSPYNGYALTAPTTLEASVTQDSYSSTNHYQQWVISVAGNDSFFIISRGNSSFYLATGDVSSTEDRNVEVRTLRSDSSDEWKIKLLSYSVGGEFSNGEDVINAANAWEECGYISEFDINPTVNSLSQNKLDSTIVFFSSHGSQHLLALPNNTFLTDGTYPSNEYAVSLSNYLLPNAKLFIFNACETAKTDETTQNLCTAAISAGVDCVIGWTEEIHPFDAQGWTSRFGERIVAGDSVVEAANYATDSWYLYSTIESWQIYGNEDLIINPVTSSLSFANARIREQSSFNQKNIYIGPYDPNMSEDIKKEFDSKIKSILADNFDSFSSETSANVRVFIKNNDQLNYNITYTYVLDDEFITMSCYNLNVKDGVITQIRDNTIGDIADVRESPTVTQEQIEEALSLGRSDVEERSENYHITGQEYKKIYYNEKDKYYIYVATSYKVAPYDAVGIMDYWYEL